MCRFNSNILTEPYYLLSKRRKIFRKDKFTLKRKDQSLILVIGIFFLKIDYKFSAQTRFYKKIKMSKTFILCMLLLLVCTLSQTDSTHTATPLTSASGESLTLNEVFPTVDKYLRATYWYYLRAAGIVYQANVDTLKTFLFFTIYRNIVGTFLVISTWDKAEQTIQVNTFVRLGDGYAAGSGALYDPVKINPLVVSLQLQPGEYMVIINQDGSITTRGTPRQPISHPTQTQEVTLTQAEKLEALMVEKGKLVDQSIRSQYWYYLRNATLASTSHTATSQRYYYVNVYMHIVGTFLVIANHDIHGQVNGINTLVRLGDGYAIDDGANYQPVNYQPIHLTPAVLQATNFGAN